MYNCVWTIDIVFGKQKEALDIIKAWGAEKFRSSHFKNSVNRLSVGHIVESPSHIVDEYLFESLADFEKALNEMETTTVQAIQRRYCSVHCSSFAKKDSVPGDQLNLFICPLRSTI